MNPLWLSVTHRVASNNHSFYKSPQAVVIIEFMETYLKVMGMKIWYSQETGGVCNRYACEDTGACSSLKLPPS